MSLARNYLRSHETEGGIFAKEIVDLQRNHFFCKVLKDLYPLGFTRCLLPQTTLGSRHERSIEQVAKGGKPTEGNDICVAIGIVTLRPLRTNTVLASDCRA